ncbi:zinc-binding alcohol dehydrogenase [Streptomyces camponoticapitis]|uniref:Zinc-binding alcohol dehydrogenase n=1 Tax=Streptomyces camponoticapitis TaxID=1616125 RepID=A0ABQ2EY77_9ACTN|nr:NADP-dependent oxidoreductase [Streptomyces camponoticapitis]GGK30769.1 zinc-binding alcohol dehydrogenase [Streptomyces camponoticapitis]
MKAVGVYHYGEPEVLEVVDLPVPEVGPGQIRVRVYAAAVNPSDVLLRQGCIDPMLAGRLTPPYRPGMDVGGVVDAIGPDTVSDLRIGDRVMAMVIPIDPSGGAYAQFIVLDARQIVRAPAGTTHAEAASLPTNGLTARLALDLLSMAPGEWIAVTGAAGAVGGYAVELAKTDELRVVADAAPTDEDLVRSLGADRIVTRGPGVTERIREVVPGGVGAVVDAALMGPGVLPAIRPGGQIALVRSQGEPGTTSLGEHKEVTVRNVFVPEYRYAEDKLDSLRVLAEEGRISLRVAEKFPADQAAEAHRRLEAGGVRGRLILDF